MKEEDVVTRLRFGRTSLQQNTFQLVRLGCRTCKERIAGIESEPGQESSIVYSHDTKTELLSRREGLNPVLQLHSGTVGGDMLLYVGL